ncbi:MAG: C40 family peptidase [Desulfobacteraceae bacterium]|nr:C40 family peptidase [Desulfobacteraceae bacterium]
MKKFLLITILILCSAGPALCSNQTRAPKALEPDDTPIGIQEAVFRQSIPSIANQFIGIPYEFGGNPQTSNTSDNSHLFFSIYTLAAQKAGLSYKGYLSMAYLLPKTRRVDKNDLKNGDLIVLKNNHAAMIYWIDEGNKMYFIYASEKRQQIISFNSENPVYQAYWVENLKGFYRLEDTMLTPIP